MNPSYLMRLSDFHLGPGNHPSGSDQDVHGGDGDGAGADPVASFLQDKIDSAKRMNEKYPGFEDQRWVGKLQSAKATYQAYVEKYGEDFPIVLVKDDPDSANRKWYGAIIAPSPKEPGQWQATYFDERGFSGDFQSKTKAEAFWDIYSSGITRPDPELLERAVQTDLFQAGVRWSQLPDDMRFKTSIDEVLKAGK